MPIEMVARAKGSPMMRPALKEERPPWLYPCSIFCRDGLPYVGIKAGLGRRGSTGIGSGEAAAGTWRGGGNSETARQRAAGEVWVRVGRTF